MEYVLSVSLDETGSTVLYDGSPVGGDVVVSHAYAGVHTIRFRCAQSGDWTFCDFEAVPLGTAREKTESGAKVLQWETTPSEIVVTDRLEWDGNYKYTLTVKKKGGEPVVSDPEIQNKRTMGRGA